MNWIDWGRIRCHGRFRGGKIPTGPCLGVKLRPRRQPAGSSTIFVYTQPYSLPGRVFFMDSFGFLTGSWLASWLCDDFFVKSLVRTEGRRYGHFNPKWHRIQVTIDSSKLSVLRALYLQKNQRLDLIIGERDSNQTRLQSEYPRSFTQPRIKLTREHLDRDKTSTTSSFQRCFMLDDIKVYPYGFLHIARPGFLASHAARST